jgi:hypothetical protein
VTTETTISTTGSSSRRRTSATSQPTSSPDGHTAGRPDHEAKPGLPGDEGPRWPRRHRQPVGDQGGGVVDQALALEHGEQPAGHAQAAADGGGGQRVGRGDDRAQGERRPAQPSPSHRVGRHGHRDRGRQDQPDGGSEIARASARRSRGEEKKPAQYSSGRQERHQDQLGRAARPRHAGARTRAPGRRGRAGSGRARDQPGQDAQARPRPPSSPAAAVRSRASGLRHPAC